MKNKYGKIKQQLNDPEIRNLVETIKNTEPLPLQQREKKAEVVDAIKKYIAYMKTNYGTVDSTSLFSALDIDKNSLGYQIPSIPHRFIHKCEYKIEDIISDVPVPDSLKEALELLLKIRDIPDVCVVENELQNYSFRELIKLFFRTLINITKKNLKKLQEKEK